MGTFSSYDLAFLCIVCLLVCLRAYTCVRYRYISFHPRENWKLAKKHCIFAEAFLFFFVLVVFVTDVAFHDFKAYGATFFEV